MRGKPTESKDGFDPCKFQKLFLVEDRHFWFRARNLVIAKILKQTIKGLRPGYRVLEIGCGTGNTLRTIERVSGTGAVVGMDLFSEGLRFAKTRIACSLVCGDATQPPFRGGFQVIGLFDVLEHLPDDIQMLQTVHSLLSDNGTLVLTLPAHQSLWSHTDVWSCHKRRYGLNELKTKLCNSGFEVKFASEYMSLLYPLRWLNRKLTGRRSEPDKGRPGETSESDLPGLKVVPVLNELLYALLSVEAFLIGKRIHLPIGTSILAVARKASAGC